MRYLQEDVEYAVEPLEFNKYSGKEVLQYAVGGLLYMPASNQKIADKIISREFEKVKSFVLDLEDALGDDMIGFGKRSIVKTIEKLHDAVEAGKITMNDIPLIFVRVRESGQMKEVYSLLGKDLMEFIAGFNIPKFDKNNCDTYIHEFKEVLDLVAKDNPDLADHLYIMPIIENKEAMYRQLRMGNLLHVNDKLREISKHVLNIRVGGADFCSLFGIRRGIRDTIYRIGVVRSVFNDIMNVFGKNYIVSGPVWEYFDGRNGNMEWKTGLENELYEDRLMGFIGKTSIHPSQLPVIQKSLIVTYNDYIDAQDILGMNANTTGVLKSASGNRMNEVKTHTNWARKVTGLARVYGVHK